MRNPLKILTAICLLLLGGLWWGLAPQKPPKTPKNSQETPKNIAKFPQPTSPKNKQIPTKPDLVLTGEAKINDLTLLSLWDPTSNTAYLLSHQYDHYQNKILHYNGHQGEALLNSEPRKFKKGTIEYSHPNPTLENEKYWGGYEKGYALFETYGDMLPAEENWETGEILSDWFPIKESDPLIKTLPPDIWDSLWSDSLAREETLKTKSPEEKEYWKGLIDGAQDAILKNTNNIKLAQWRPSFGEPAITSPRRKSSQSNAAFLYQIETNTHTTEFSAEGLPAGLTLNPHSGLIFGTPLHQNPKEGSIEVYDTILTATNEHGTTVSTLEISVFPP